MKRRNTAILDIRTAAGSEKGPLPQISNFDSPHVAGITITSMIHTSAVAMSRIFVLFEKKCFGVLIKAMRITISTKNSTANKNEANFLGY